VEKWEIGGEMFLVNVKLTIISAIQQGTQDTITSSSHTLGVREGESNTSSCTLTVSYGLCVAREVGAIGLLRCFLAGFCERKGQFKSRLS
jgi:hypothetical protein